MQFTYKIQNYVESENRLFVVYTPSDTSLPSWGNWIGINSEMTEQDMKAAVIAGFPFYRYQIQEIVAAKNLVGSTDTAIFTPPQETTQVVTENISVTEEQRARMQRNNLLRQTDWMFLQDSTISEDTKEQYRIYRQLLRDVPEQNDFPSSVVWPTKPN